MILLEFYLSFIDIYITLVLSTRFEIYPSRCMQLGEFYLGRILFCFDYLSLGGKYFGAINGNLLPYSNLFLSF